MGVGEQKITVRSENRTCHGHEKKEVLIKNLKSSNFHRFHSQRWCHLNSTNPISVPSSVQVTNYSQYWPNILTGNVIYERSLIARVPFFREANFKIIIMTRHVLKSRWTTIFITLNVYFHSNRVRSDIVALFILIIIGKYRYIIFITHNNGFENWIIDHNVPTAIKMFFLMTCIGFPVRSCIIA